MKKIITIFIMSTFFVCPVYASLTDYFGALYTNYLDLRKVDYKDRDVLDLLYEISSSKVECIEEFLTSAENKDEYKLALDLLYDEYDDLMENINFELNFTPNCPISKRTIKKLRRNHKKVILSLAKEFVDEDCKKGFFFFKH